MKNQYIIWIIAFLITVLAAYYQRITGPTYAIRNKVEISGCEVKYSLPRTAVNTSDPVIEINVKSGVTGVLRYKRYNTNDEWNEFNLVSSENGLKAILPKQPAAGKLVYEIDIIDNGKIIPLHSQPIVIRFKGDVPGWIIILHVIFIFFAMLLSNLTGIMAIRKNPGIMTYIWITVIVLFIGGMIMGPIVQKYAFGEFWTGVPFGWDLTDNKTLIAMLIWIIALFVSRKKPSYAWVIAASVVMLVIFLIPHSMFGSELDYNTGIIKQGQ